MDQDKMMSTSTKLLTYRMSGRHVWSAGASNDPTHVVDGQERKMRVQNACTVCQICERSKSIRSRFREEIPQFARNGATKRTPTWRWRWFDGELSKMLLQNVWGDQFGIGTSLRRPQRYHDRHTEFAVSDTCRPQQHYPTISILIIVRVVSAATVFCSPRFLCSPQLQRRGGSCLAKVSTRSPSQEG